MARVRRPNLVNGGVPRMAGATQFDEGGEIPLHRCLSRCDGYVTSRPHPPMGSPLQSGLMLERASGHPKRIRPSSGFRLAGRVLAIGAVACFLAASCSGGGQKVNGGGEQSPSGGDTNGSPAQTGSPSARGKFPLGEISILSGQSSCQGVPSCQIPYQVTCPDVQQPARGVLVVTTPAGSPRGLVTILLGGAGV